MYSITLYNDKLFAYYTIFYFYLIDVDFEEYLTWY